MNTPPIQKIGRLILAVMILSAALFPIPSLAGAALSLPARQAAGEVDESGNDLSRAGEPESEPLQPQGTEADPAVLCYTNQVGSANPCTRVAGLFSGVTTITSLASFPTNLSPYDVVYFGYDEGFSLNSLSGQLNSYVQAGGGLVVSQPNLVGSVTIFPPGFEMNVTSITWPEYPAVPGPVQFTLAGFFHPILRGLNSQDPSGNFDTVPISTLGPAWTVLLRSVGHPNVALAAGTYGSGRLVFHSGNISSNSIDQGSNAYVRQMIEWAGAANAAPGPDMRITGIEVTQAIQDLNNSVQLVANKRTYVRVHVSSPSSISDVSANLSARRGSTTLYPTLLPGNPGADITVKVSPDRGQLNDSYWFELPASWTSSGKVTLTARLDPANAKNDPNLSNNVRTVEVDFLTTPPLRLRLVNVRYKVGSTTYQASNTHLDRLESWLRRAYPIHSLLVKRQVYDYPTTGLPNVDTLNTRLGFMRLLRIIFAGESPKTVYYGIVDDGGGFMRGKAAGIPGVVASGPTGPGTFGWDTDGSYGDWYGGHEIAHTRNRYHAMFCGAAGGTTYPYTSGNISPSLTGNTAIYGFDITSRAIYPPNWKDVMTYCSNQWISDFTYEGIRSYMLTIGLLSSQVVQAEQVLLVTGIAYLDDGTAELMDVQQIDAAAEIEPVDPGFWEIVLVGEGGDDLQVSYFNPLEMTDAEESPGRPALISEMVPFIEGTARVEIRYMGKVVAERSASPNAPEIMVVEPKRGEYRGEITASWEGSDPDGDPLTYTVLFSNDGGKTWEVLASGLEEKRLELNAADLPGGQSQLKVIANDGFNSTEGMSEPFFVFEHNPEAQILSPDEEALFFPAQPVVLEGAAYDMEDGTIEDDEAFSWASDLAGELGSGRSLLTVDLPSGKHVITLTVTDSSGRTGTAQRTVIIAQAGDPIPANLEVAPFSVVAVAYPQYQTEPISLTLRTSSGEEVDWKVEGLEPWLSLEQTSGETPEDMLLTFNTEGLSLGDYTAELIFQSDKAENSPVVVPVTLHVLQPPILPVYLPLIGRQ